MGYIYYHALFRNLYFLPLVFAGIWFGLRAAVTTSLAITALYVPFVVMNWEGFSVTDFSRVMEVVVFNGAAVILGLIPEREKRARKNLRETESLAAMGKALEADLSASLPQVEFDAVRMEQVLINLVVNALQASPEGETVFLRTYQEGDRIYLEVVDHGPGIPEQDRGKIFSPFFTTKREGTGLGLPIALKILSAHGGTLEVLETGEKGAAFQVGLPLKRS
jgi:signal transduction histidine kinase